jgi:chorismate synthase
MSGNTFGKIFRVTTFGESHGKAIGCIVDGCPSGIELCEEDLQLELDKRKPGQGIAGTKRNEEDKAEIISGVFEGKTTGTPITIIIFNQDQKSRDYSIIKNVFRPGHADFTYYKKYGLRDFRGGGRASARETAARVAAGAIAKKILKKEGIIVNAFVKEIGSIKAKNYSKKDIENIYENELRMPDKIAQKEAIELLKNILKENDSIGGVVEVIASGVPAGLGEPVFDKLDAKLAFALMSIPAVKGVEIGAGFESSKKKGSQNNDLMCLKDGKECFLSNNSGGILGGISNGDSIIARIAIKPTASISKEQEFLNIDKKVEKLSIVGRHDACIAIRAVPIAESMVALTLLDLLLEQKVQKM